MVTFTNEKETKIDILKEEIDNLIKLKDILECNFNFIPYTHCCLN